MVLKPPEGSSSSLTDSTVGRAHCGKGETTQAQKQDMKGLIDRRETAPKALQTLAGKFISQRRDPSSHSTNPGLMSPTLKCKLSHKITATLCRSY